VKALATKSMCASRVPLARSGALLEAGPGPRLALPSSSPCSAGEASPSGRQRAAGKIQNVCIAILSVGLIVFVTVASPMTSLLITVNVAFCIIEILGFTYALGIVIDSASVINIELAVGLSVEYCAHVGHCFMTKGSSNKDTRVKESLADIGAAVLSGAISTFLAVFVLLFSSSYVFETLSKQFALTVALGLHHGLVALPVVLSLLGAKPYSSAEDVDGDASEEKSLVETIGETDHSGNKANSSDGSGPDQDQDDRVHDTIDLDDAHSEVTA
jgi:Patched family